MTGWTAIQTITPSSGSSINFTNLSGYNNFMITWEIITNTPANLFFTFNNDNSGTSYSHQYNYTKGVSGYPYLSSLGWKGSGIPYTYLVYSGISLGYGSFNVYGGAGTGGKMFKGQAVGFTGTVGTTGSNLITFTDGVWANNAPITSIQMFMTEANFTGGSYTLYGSTS
jgi:hypothetical protein